MDSNLTFELASLDAIGQAELVAAGELAAVELLEAAIARLEATRHLNAVIADLFDRAREQAAALDTAGTLRAGEAGPLTAVPFLLKDLGASLAGTPEAMGSRALRTHVATESACTTEPSLFGPTVNPWSPSITRRMDIARECDWLGSDLTSARRHLAGPADRRAADGTRRDDPASARRATRSRRALVTSTAQYVMSPAWCETSVS